MKLLKTGIAGLDEFLTGGLPPKILLLAGLPGSGNDVFAKQIAYFRAKETQVTYFTVNATADSVREDMNLFNWDLAPLEAAGKWRFQNVAKTGPIVESIVEEMQQHRSVIVDSLSELLLTRKVEEAVSLLAAMSRENKDSEQYHLLLLTEGMQDERAETAMQHFAEGVILFSTNWASEMTNRDLLVKKMKGTFTPSRKLPYSIGRRGFLIETATRIT